MASALCHEPMPAGSTILLLPPASPPVLRLRDAARGRLRSAAAGGPNQPAPARARSDPMMNIIIIIVPGARTNK